MPPSANSAVPPLPRPGLDPPLATAQALSLFDSLPATTEAELLGSWRGDEVPSEHPFAGLLTTCHWHGKRFDSAEQVHPLIFETNCGRLVSVEPRLVMPALNWVDRLPALRSAAMGRIFQRLVPLLAASGGRARLRRIEHRGVLTAAMLYDHLPIVDVFRRLDTRTLLGLMDLKGMEQPYCFLLRRETD